MATDERNHVEVLSRDDVPEVVSVLSESFFDYPVMRFVLGSDAEYAARLAKLVAFTVMARVFRDEVLLGVRRSPSGLIAAATVSTPNPGPNSPELEALREETWRSLGDAARSRYETFGAITARFAMREQHVHLNMIGVRRAMQGQGLGRAVLEAVHALSASDASSTGVSLTTEVEANVALYEHVGYAVIGRAPVESAFTSWTMFRPDRRRRST